jgi:hypothetical protein
MRGYWLNHYFPKMMRNSIRQMPSFDVIEEAMSEAGFVSIDVDNYYVQPELKDQFLYCGKHSPEIYLNGEVRKGISSFSSLANRDEVEKGLDHLNQDLMSGKIHEIMASYENDFGDYSFVKAEKISNLNINIK